MQEQKFQEERMIFLLNLQIHGDIIMDLHVRNLKVSQDKHDFRLLKTGYFLERETFLPF